MKNITSRIISALLAAVMVAALFAGCNKKPTDNNYIDVNGKRIDIPYAMKIEDKEISMEEYRYYFLNLKNSYDRGDESYWETNPTAEETLKASTLDYCKLNNAVELMAESLNVSMTDEELALVDKQITENKAKYETDKEYQEWLSGQYLTEDLYKKVLTQSYLQKKTLEFVFSENGPEKITNEDEIINSKFVHALHILIADKAAAEAALDRVNSGEDFVTLMKELNEDPGETEEGYTFTTGAMVKPFEDAAFALKENEVSGLVETSYGYHLIKRLPLDENYIKENRENMLNQYKGQRMYELLDAFVADLEIENSKYYDEFGIDTIVDNSAEDK